MECTLGKPAHKLRRSIHYLKYTCVKKWTCDILVMYMLYMSSISTYLSVHDAYLQPTG